MADKPQFQIQMKGAGLVPEAVRASDLAILLTNIEGAIVETAKAQNVPLAYEPDEVLVSLVRVESGNSSDLTLAVARPISPAATIISHAVARREFGKLTYKTQKYLYNISSHAIKKRWAYEFHSVDGLNMAHAVISYEFPVPKPSAVPTTSGQSTLWGNLYIIGREPPSVTLRLRNGKLFPASVTREIATEMQSQNLLWKDVGLIGIATWRMDDWSLESFNATSLADYRPHEASLIETFEKLREASQGRWDKVDPIDYVKSLRSEEA